MQTGYQKRMGEIQKTKKKIDFNGRYILDKNGKPKPEPDLLKWADWFEDKNNRIIRQDRFGEILISTIFLGLDHGWGGDVILWETMIFGGKEDGLQWRYRSRKEALKGHAKAVNLAKK